MFWRLLVTYGVVFVASISLLGVVVARRVESRELLQIQDKLEAYARGASAVIHTTPSESLRALTSDLSQRLGPKLRITLINKDGKVLADSAFHDPDVMENHLSRPEIVAASEAKVGTHMRVSH